MAGVVLDVVRDHPSRPILLLVDTQGQRLSHRDELLGINGYMAHLAKCLDLARRQGAPGAGVGLLPGGQRRLSRQQHAGGCLLRAARGGDPRHEPAGHGPRHQDPAGAADGAERQPRRCSRRGSGTTCAWVRSRRCGMEIFPGIWPMRWRPGSTGGPRRALGESREGRRSQPGGRRAGAPDAVDASGPARPGLAAAAGPASSGTPLEPGEDWVPLRAGAGGLPWSSPAGSRRCRGYAAARSCPARHCGQAADRSPCGGGSLPGVAGPPALEDALVSAPEAWRPRLGALAESVRPGSAGPGVRIARLADLSGDRYLRPGSDIDLLFHPRNRREVEQLIATLVEFDDSAVPILPSGWRDRAARPCRGGLAGTVRPTVKGAGQGTPWGWSCVLLQPSSICSEASQHEVDSRNPYLPDLRAPAGRIGRAAIRALTLNWRSTRSPVSSSPRRCRQP